MSYIKRMCVGFILLICFLGNNSPCSASSRGGIVLALSGGGTKGLAHIGVLQVLEENNIPIAGIVGTSMGAIIGGLAASGYTGIELEEVVNNIDLGSLLAEKDASMVLPLGERTSENSAIPWFSLGSRRGIGGALGGFSGVKLLEKFSQMAARVQVIRFSELPIPFAAVATDLETGEKVVLQSGSLASAMRASMAIPALFEPWPVGGRLLIDGGLVSNLPVLTAKELFPGCPVIAVNVTSEKKSRSELRTLVDVVDQSITVLTQQNVEREIREADLILTPSVGKLPLFDATQADFVIAAGRKETLAHLKAIASLAQMAPELSPRRKQPSQVLTDICVRGLPDMECEKLRTKHLSQIGKPIDPQWILRVNKEISRRMDVLAVDYHLEEDHGGAVVVFSVQRRPQSEVRIGGYTTNLHPYRWLYVNSIHRDIYKDGDALKLNLKIGTQWAADVGYLSSSELSKAWEVNLSAQRWELTPRNVSEERGWDRYGLGVTRHFTMGNVLAGAGLGGERVHYKGKDEDSWGPTFYLTYNTLDDMMDPTKGSMMRVAFWWPDYDELLYRMNLFFVTSFSENWRLYLRGGFAEGDMTEAGHAVYLGAAEELYSYADKPIEAERMIWVNAGLRRVFLRSWWGNLTAELFGGAGWTYDNGGSRLDSVWETGLSLSAPGHFFDGRLMFLYNDQSDFKVGFFIGKPIWSHYPLP
ncbi:MULTISPECIES: patatin-like phospholipase family protein [Aminobacterium]|uniref:patatin-like phospholipase family protein n=1 Tax=Aminobacterium TaxID=81466 RepID=UPI002579FF3B|nr:patatin-like phospholipase family protein [Aminobacterium sp. UBA4834]